MKCFISVPLMLILGLIRIEPFYSKFRSDFFCERKPLKDNTKYGLLSLAITSLLIRLECYAVSGIEELNDYIEEDDFY